MEWLYLVIGLVLIAVIWDASPKIAGLLVITIVLVLIINANNRGLI